MKTVEEIRRLNLVGLRKKLTLAEMNKRLGLNSRDSTLSQICNKWKGANAKAPKVMGPDLARRLEKALKLPEGFMDTDPEAWPFKHIDRSRFEDLRDHQKIEIQGQVREMIQRFEIANQPKVTEFKPPKLVEKDEPAIRPTARKDRK